MFTDALTPDVEEEKKWKATFTSRESLKSSLNKKSRLQSASPGRLWYLHFFFFLANLRDEFLLSEPAVSSAIC